MLMSKTASQGILNALCGKGTGTAAFGKADNCWLGLSTVLPTTNPAAFAEPSAGMNYARVEIHSLMNTTYQSVSQGDQSAVDHDRRIGNAADINFNAAIVPSDPTAATGADWGAIAAFGLFQSATGGTPYAWGALTDGNGDPTTVTVSTKNTLHFLKGRFEIYLDDAGSVSANANA